MNTWHLLTDNKGGAMHIQACNALPNQTGFPSAHWGLLPETERIIAMIPKYRILKATPNPFEDWGAYANKDANRILTTPDGKLIGFHVTTIEGMEGITANGPEYTSCKIGFDGRETPKGFWLNNVCFGYPTR